LNGALERAGAVGGIVAGADQNGAGGIGELEGDVAVGQPGAQAAKLDLDDFLELVFIEAMENDDFVDAVEEFGAEVIAQALGG
jgi:hypothetical protein